MQPTSSFIIPGLPHVTIRSLSIRYVALEGSGQAHKHSVRSAPRRGSRCFLLPCDCRSARACSVGMIGRVLGISRTPSDSSFSSACCVLTSFLALSRTMLLLVVTLAVAILCVVYIRSNDAKLDRLPPEALAISPKRWTTEDINTCHASLKDGPSSLFEGKLPPKTGRRYIVIGGVRVISDHTTCCN